MALLSAVRVADCQGFITEMGIDQIGPIILNGRKAPEKARMFGVFIGHGFSFRSFVQ